jgi:Ca2+-binding RTX toxin-like protein
MLHRFLPVFLLLLLGAAAVAGVAGAKTSHAGWPKIDGVLKMHKADESSAMQGTDRNDELLGGHGSDTINGGEGNDVLWGDYKPGGQPGNQTDHINGGNGNEFIYASHGRNVIDAGSGHDTIHAHFGRGSIDCGGGSDVLFISHKSKKDYKISNCETISYKTLGY